MVPAYLSSPACFSIHSVRYQLQDMHLMVGNHVLLAPTCVYYSYLVWSFGFCLSCIAGMLFDSQRAIPAAGHEVQEVPLGGDQGDEPYMPLLGAACWRRKLSGLTQDDASFEVRRSLLFSYYFYRHFYFPAQLVYSRRYPLRPSGQAEVTRVVPSPPRSVMPSC